MDVINLSWYLGLDRVLGRSVLCPGGVSWAALPLHPKGTPCLYYLIHSVGLVAPLGTFRQPCSKDHQLLEQPPSGQPRVVFSLAIHPPVPAARGLSQTHLRTSLGGACVRVSVVTTESELPLVLKAQGPHPRPAESILG